MLAINQTRKCFNEQTKRWVDCKKTISSKGFSNPRPPSNLCCIPSNCCLPNACQIFNAMINALNDYRNLGRIEENISGTLTPFSVRFLGKYLGLSSSPYNIEVGLTCLNQFELGINNPSFTGDLVTECTTQSSFGCYTANSNLTNDGNDAYLTWITQCVEFTSRDLNCPTLYFCYEVMFDDNPYFPGDYQANFRNAHICINDPGLFITNCTDCTNNNPLPPVSCDIYETIDTDLTSTVNGGGWNFLSTFNIFVPTCCNDNGLDFTITSNDVDLVFLDNGPTITANSLHTFDLRYQYNGMTPGVYNITVNVASPTCGSIDYNLILTVNACDSRISDINNPPYQGLIPLTPISFNSGNNYIVGDFYIYVPSCCGSIGNNFSIYTQDANITMVTVGGISVNGINHIQMEITSLTPGVYNNYVLTIALPGCGKIDYLLDITVL